MNGLVQQETIPYAKTSQAGYTEKGKMRNYLVQDEWNDFLMTTPFEQLSAYDILRSQRTHQFRHIRVEGRNHKAEWMWFYVCLLRMLDVKESSDRWCQRTPPYSINVESNTYRVLEKGKHDEYYLHLHDGAIRNLSTVKHRIQKRRWCSTELTTNAASICVVPVVNMAKKIAYRLTNMGLTIQIPVQLLIPQWECKTLPSQVFKFVWVTTTRESATLSIKFRNDALIVGNDVVIDLGTKNVNCQAGLPCWH